MTPEQKTVYNEPMPEVTPGTPSSLEQRPPEYADIRSGNYGFTYTIDRGLTGALEHGLLSRMEERKRGLRVRVHESRSAPDTLYFTTLLEDVYVRGSFDEPKDINEEMKDVVGIVVERPDYARRKEGHFGIDSFVNPQDFKALVFIDQFATDTGVSSYGVPRYKFQEGLPQGKIDTRVEALRKSCQERGIDIPIYGISGNLYWPEKKWARELETQRSR